MTATDRPRPGLRTRLAAAMHGEIDAATVEAYRRAGATAYSDQADAEQVRTTWCCPANYFFRCPWSEIYFVYRPVVIAGQSLTPIQQFAFDVSVEPMLAAAGGEFARHLVFGPFRASSQVDYGDRGSRE